ncbi:hypothetical protein OHA98_38570 [Streptomyces sp. NBC_00654]|nr:hypothetical protein [Streptomyces sp. NBC_00654]
MPDLPSDGPRLFLPLPPAAGSAAGAGSAQPGRAWAAQRLGLTPVPASASWLELARVYVIAREYLGPAEHARGRELDCAAWITALLARYSREEYLHVLAALNHATTSDVLTEVYQERFLARLAPDAAQLLRTALAGGVDGQQRWFLARQIVLRTMSLVLVSPRPEIDSVQAEIATAVGQLDLECASVLLVHLVGDTLTRERTPREPLLGGSPQSLAMEMIANNLFNEPDDAGDLLARHRLLWILHGDRVAGARARPVSMLEEATGLAFDDIIALAFVYYSSIASHAPDNPVAVNAFTGIAVDPEVIERFLDRFAVRPDDLAAQLRDCPLPWQLLPIQDRPLLRLDDSVVVLDERYLLERATQGLYWLVHDHEKYQHGERARLQWTQVYAAMVEDRVKEQLRRLAPPLVGAGASTLFTEDDLALAFPKTKAADVGIDFGTSTVLVEIVSATVSVATREHADADAFRKDAEKIVVKKARQLSVTAHNLLTDPQPAHSPLTGPAKKIFPVAVRGGHFPVNPITRRYLEECFADERLFQHGGIQDLALLDMEELEACEALHQNLHLTLPDLLADWQASEYSKTSFRSFLTLRFGGRNIGRPDDIEAALHETTDMIADRLGFREDSTG